VFFLTSPFIERDFQKVGFGAVPTFRKRDFSGLEVTHCGGTTTARTESARIIGTPPKEKGELKRSRLEYCIGFLSAPCTNCKLTSRFQRFQIV
jgi:hypothetical protein